MQHYTKYETARLIGARALQIAMGAPFMIKMDEEDLQKIGYNPIEIAKKELAADVLPLTVRKTAPVLKQSGIKKQAEKDVKKTA